MKSDFGNPAVISHLKLQTRFEGPKITTNNRYILCRYYQQLKTAIFWLKSLKQDSSSLFSIGNIFKAVSKLLNDLRHSFYKYSKNLSMSNLSLEDFERWLENKLKELYNPIAEIIASSEGPRKSKDIQKDPI